jgi:hypothetical protein
MAAESIDARVRYLEQVTKQMGEQVRVMKQLVATEVADLKAAMQLQVAEVKQIVMSQDRVYQDRIRRLEARSEQLSEFCLHLAKSSGSSGALRLLPPELLNADVAAEAARSIAGGGGAAGAAGASAGGGGGGGGGSFDEDDDAAENQSVDTVAAKYKEKLDAIYRYYTTSNINVFHPSMTLPHFTRLLRDCHMCDFGSDTTAELLWMAVMRRLGKKRRRRQANLRNATTLVTGKGPLLSGRRTVEQWAQERLDEIPLEAFPDAMFILSMEKLGKHRAELSPDRVFEAFLLTDVFPVLDQKLEQASGITNPAVPGSSARSVAPAALDAYKTEEVKAVMKEHMATLRAEFKKAIMTTLNGRESEHMPLDAFVEFVRRQELMPLISKPDLRQIFTVCCAIEATKNPKAKADTVTVPGLVNALYHMAERIYGDALFADKYPTPEARIRKLTAKMFLLRDRETPRG